MKRRTFYSIVAVLGLASAAAIPGEATRPQRQLSADQAIECIRLAVAARPGNVRELEVKVDGKRTLCEVEVIDANGKKLDVYVDIAAKTVVRVDD